MRFLRFQFIRRGLPNLSDWAGVFNHGAKLRSIRDHTPPRVFRPARSRAGGGRATSNTRSFRERAEHGTRGACASQLPPRAGLAAVFATAIVLFLAPFVHAQDSQFSFDLNGNLLVQMTETNASPQIIGQPQNRIVSPGEAASFLVVAADTRALTYEWRFNGVPIGGSATNDALVLQNVTTNNEGSYAVVLTNPSGSVTSAPALLMIDSDSDGLPDSWERTFFANLNQNATADFDGDGISNLQEFRDGTNPTNDASALFRLTVFTDGGGVVELNPTELGYTNGQTVTLTATAFPQNIFHAWIGDTNSRNSSITLTMTSDKTVKAYFGPIIFTWTNNADGDWNVAGNWSPRLAPGSNDTVIIPIGATVTLNTAADCFDLTLGSATAGPTLTGSGNLTVFRNFLWAGGTMAGSGRTIIPEGATLNIANPAQVNLNSRILENGGTILWTGAGNMVWFGGAVLTNRASALFEAQNAANFLFFNGANRFDNAGTFRKSASAGQVLAGIVFNNFGTVDIQTGTLSLGFGGTHDGSFDLSANVGLIFSGGIHTGGASSRITGSGQLTVSSGTANLAGLVNVSGSNTFSGGTASLTGNYICTNNTLTISGGTANFSGTGLVSPAVLNLSNGTLDGGNMVTVNNAMNWTGGDMVGNSRTVISPGATLNISSLDRVVVRTRTLENGGTALWTGTGNLVLVNGAVLTNRAGALFQVQGAGSFAFNRNENGRIDNAGTFRKSNNTGPTAIGVIGFNNFGTVDIRAGTLTGGSYVSSTNALLNCRLSGTTAGTGYGCLQIGGAVTLNGTLSVDLAEDFVPTPNDTFTVLTAGTRNGTFASFLYPSNAVAMELSNEPSSVIVRATGLTGPSFVTAGQLPDAGQFIGYTQQVAAVAGSMPITFGLASGSPPAGLSLSSGGLLSGIPTVAGTNIFAILITDGQGATNQKTFNLRVVAPVSAPAGLISWWRAEEDTLDSVSTNHGVALNGATYATGMVGRAFSFDGADDYISIPDSLTLRPPSVTLEAWVKYFATNGTRIVMVKPVGNNTTFDSYGLALQDGIVIAAICDNGGFGPFLNSPSPIGTGQWYHLAFTFDDPSKLQALYVNGALVASGLVNKTMAYDSHPLLIGADLENGAFSFFHNGLIDEVSIYNRALATDEIAAIYAAGAGGKQIVREIFQPFLLTPEIIGTDLKLSWTAVSNAVYRLEFKTDLTNPSSWSAVPGDIIATGSNASRLEPLTLGNRFYRIRVLP